MSKRMLTEGEMVNLSVEITDSFDSDNVFSPASRMRVRETVCRTPHAVFPEFYWGAWLLTAQPVEECTAETCIWTDLQHPKQQEVSE